MMEALDQTVGYYTYRRGTEGEPEETLVFTQAGKNGYVLRYCFPVEKTTDIVEYNAYIQQLHDNLSNAGVPVETYKYNSFPEMPGVSIHSLKALDAFSGHANHSTGHCHNTDYDLWMKFIYATMYIGEVDIVKAQLSDVLEKQLNWTDDWPVRLTIDYEYAIGSILFFEHVEKVHKAAIYNDSI